LDNPATGIRRVTEIFKEVYAGQKTLDYASLDPSCQGFIEYFPF
jgi:hypothetical protein